MRLLAAVALAMACFNLPLACTDWSSLYEGCGDGGLDAGEQCDDGNHHSGDGCDAVCRVEPQCESSSEACAGASSSAGTSERGGANSDAGAGSMSGPSVCGNQVVESGEECDDGNTNDDDACVACNWARCGDAKVWRGVEDCDDENADDTDGCTNSCLSCSVGRGVVYWPENGHCYEAIASLQTWGGARGTCAKRGEHLLSLGDPGEADALCALGLLGTEPESWLGLGDVIGSGQFQFDSGEPLKRPYWGPAQPGDAAEDAVYQKVSAANTCKAGQAYDQTWWSAPTNDTSDKLPSYCERHPVEVREATHHAYRVLYPIKSWLVADEACRALGGHLATIDSADEAAFINGITHQLQVWLGARDDQTPGQLGWVTGEPFDYEAFAVGQPVLNTPGDNCLALLADDAWQVLSCSTGSMKALCELE